MKDERLHPRLAIAKEKIGAFCHKWNIVELALFGSVLRDDFGPDSDVDVLVTFAPEASVTLWDWGPMMEELRAIVGRKVDLIEKPAIRNPFRRRAILGNHVVIYAA